MNKEEFIFYIKVKDTLWNDSTSHTIHFAGIAQRSRACIKGMYILKFNAYIFSATNCSICENCRSATTCVDVDGLEDVNFPKNVMVIKYLEK